MIKSHSFFTEFVNPADMSLVSPVTDVVIVIYLSDGLEVARKLKVGNLHFSVELSRVAVDHEPLVVPVHYEDVALVVSDDSSGLGYVSRDIAVRSVDNLNSCHYICRVEPANKNTILRNNYQDLN